MSGQKMDATGDAPAEHALRGILLEGGFLQQAATAVEERPNHTWQPSVIGHLCRELILAVRRSSRSQLVEQVDELVELKDYLQTQIELLDASDEQDQAETFAACNPDDEDDDWGFSDAASQDARPVELAQDAGPADSARPRLLIVDDEWTSRELLAAQLAAQCECDSAEGGEEAVAAVRQALEEGRPYDAVCLDIMMPDLDGHAVLEMIRRCEHEHDQYGQRGAKVFMTTAMTGETHQERAYKSGCQTYLNKPVDTRELLAAMHHLGVFQQRESQSPGAHSSVEDGGVALLHCEQGASQRCRVIQASRSGISLLVKDVAQLRPGKLVELDHKQTEMRAQVESIRPQNKDGLHPVTLTWAN